MPPGWMQLRLVMPFRLANSINMNGNPILNAGVPSDPNGVVTVEFALQNYGAAAIQPQLPKGAFSSGGKDSWTMFEP